MIPSVFYLSPLNVFLRRYVRFEKQWHRFIKQGYCYLCFNQMRQKGDVIDVMLGQYRSCAGIAFARSHHLNASIGRALTCAAITFTFVNKNAGNLREKSRIFLTTILTTFGDHCRIGCLQINYNNVETKHNDRLNIRREKVRTNEQSVRVTIFSSFLFSFILLIFDPFWWLQGLLLKYIFTCVWIHLVCGGFVQC